MKHKPKSLDTFYVVGIATRANNMTEAAERKIATLWESFYSLGIAHKIKNKESDDVYCIYTEYKGNYTDDYTTIVGCKVSTIENLPDELISIKIGKGNYLEFIAEGKIPECVMETWNHIWCADYNRAYKADFDIYGADCKDPMNAEVTTYLSIF